MSESFFVEFRLRGYAKKYANWASARALRESKKLGLKKIENKKFVSHITLFGPARTNNLGRVKAEVEKISRKYTLIPFKLGGFDTFQNQDANWLYLNVQPFPDLEQFRYDLAQSLCSLENVISNTCSPFDRNLKFKFHSSIGKFAPRNRDKFEKLFDYAKTECNLEEFRQHNASVFSKLLNLLKKLIFSHKEDSLQMNQHLLRVTVLGRKSHIQFEYDLVLKKILSRREALGGYWWKKTIEALKTELSPPKEEHLSVSDASKCYFIGDTHFGHKNTIFKFIHRPFSNVTEMDEEMKRRWNRTVGENDRVYFLGDYTGPPSKKLRIYYEKLKDWTAQLKGVKTSILGNHDRNGGCIEFEKARILHVDGRTFLLIHDPKDKKIKTIKTRYDWIIHGHKHNNEMDRYPFINGEQKTINVSVELIKYQPVRLSDLLKNLDSIKRMRTIDSQPEHW